MSEILKIFSLRIIFTLAFIIPAGIINADNKMWVETNSLPAFISPVVTQEDIEIYNFPDKIIIKVKKEVQVNLYTILGKPVASQTLQPGDYEYTVSNHGVYIIKTNYSSSKITV